MSTDGCTRDFVASHPAAAARVLERFAPADLAALLGGLPVKVAAPCLVQMAPSAAAACLAMLGSERAAAIVRELPVPVAAALARRLERAVRTGILGALPQTSSAAVRLALRYPQGTAGSLADPHVVAVREEMSVRDAVALARREPRLLRKYLYVCDERNRLLGTVDVRQCLIQPGRSTIGSLAERRVVTLPARSRLAQAREHAGWWRFALLPVVDRQGGLLGVLRRSALEHALGEEVQAEPGSGMLEAAVDLAELYWDTSMQLFLAKAPERTPHETEEGNEHGREG